MGVSGIYKIQSITKPERIYFGSAVNIKARWRSHLFDLRKNKHHSKKLQRHYDKYGKSDLMFSILLGCDKEDLIKIEQYFLDSYRPYFNNSLTAGNNLGLKRGSPWNKGKKATPEAILHQRNSHIGNIPWNKGKKGMQVVWNKGLKGFGKGRKTTEETKDKMRKSALNRKNKKAS
jgi:group I intron endonuclease